MAAAWIAPIRCCAVRSAKLQDLRVVREHMTSSSMSNSPASATGQPSPSPQAQPKAHNMLRKPIRRPASGSVSSQPASPHSVISQTSTLPTPQNSPSPAPALAGPYSQGTMQPMQSAAPSEPMSQRSSISESPSYNGAQCDNALSSCKICNHCKSGGLANPLSVEHEL